MTSEDFEKKIRKSLIEKIDKAMKESYERGYQTGFEAGMEWAKLKQDVQDNQ